MKKTLEIYKYELRKVMLRPGYFVMTLLVPVLFLLAILVMHGVVGQQISIGDELQEIGVVNESGLTMESGPVVDGNTTFVTYETREAGLRALTAGEVSYCIVFPGHYMDSGLIELVSLKRHFLVPRDMDRSVRSFALDQLLAGNSATVVERAKAPSAIILQVVDLEGNPAEEQGGLANFIIPTVFAMLMAMSMIFSSSYMVQGLGEEKENRVIEVLLSSVSPDQLLVGKLAAFSTAGFVQVLVWVASLPILMRLFAGMIASLPVEIDISAKFLGFGVVYFVLGYLLFATLAAGTGATRANIQEAQQLSAVYSLVVMVPLWLLSVIMNFPDLPFWPVLTVFPLTAPAMVMIRIGMGNLALWEIFVSLATLVIAVLAAFILARRCFRTSLLEFKIK